MRPRNLSVPSCRPRPRGGCKLPLCQLVSGSGEGQHTSVMLGYRTRAGASASVHSTHRDQGGAPMCSSSAFYAAASQLCQPIIARLIPSASSEAAGSPALLRYS